MYQPQTRETLEKVHLGCATVRSDLVEVRAGDVNSSHDKIGANVALVPEQAYKVKSLLLKTR